MVKSKNERKNYIRISKGLIRKRSVLGDNVKENSEEIQNDDDPQESDAEMENEVFKIQFLKKKN